MVRLEANLVAYELHSKLRQQGFVVTYVYALRSQMSPGLLPERAGLATPAGCSSD